MTCVLPPAVKKSLSWPFRILKGNEWGISVSIVTGLSMRVPVCPRCHTSLQLDEPRAFPVSANFSSMMSEYPQPAPTWAESVSSAVPTERFEEGCRTLELYRPQHITQHTYVATMLPLICSWQIFSSIFSNSLPFFPIFFSFYDTKLDINNTFTQFFPIQNSPEYKIMYSERLILKFSEHENNERSKCVSPQSLLWSHCSSAICV